MKINLNIKGKPEEKHNFNINLSKIKEFKISYVYKRK